jgi:hypothetical protein
MNSHEDFIRHPGNRVNVFFCLCQDKIEMQTEITAVTVFAVGAQVHRSGEINLRKEKPRLKLQDSLLTLILKV